MSETKAVNLDELERLHKAASVATAPSEADDVDRWIADRASFANAMLRALPSLLARLRDQDEALKAADALADLIGDEEEWPNGTKEYEAYRAARARLETERGGDDAAKV